MRDVGWLYRAWCWMTNIIWQCRPRVYLPGGHEVISCLAISPDILLLTVLKHALTLWGNFGIINFFLRNRQTHRGLSYQLTGYCRNISSALSPYPKEWGLKIYITWIMELVSLAGYFHHVWNIRITSPYTPVKKLININLTSEFTDVCMTGGIRHTSSHTNVRKFVKFQFSQLI